MSVAGIGRPPTRREALARPVEGKTVTGDQPDPPPRTIPVEPPVHVETFTTHLTATWKAGGPSAFIEAVRALEQVPGSAPTVVDNGEVAGRQRMPLSAVVPEADSTTYLRVEPDAPWTPSWEARTQPVISISGAPPAVRCRRLHVATTDCPAWDDDAFAALRQVASEARR